MSNNLYDDKSIQSLSPRDFTRLHPGVYAGSTEYSTQLLIEVVSNAVDEWVIGHGNVINVEYEDDGSCKVEDFAQGFPVNVLRDDGETVLQASFDVLNTSGKFTDDGVYDGVALGLNGIGNKLVNFLSDTLYVKTVRDDKFEELYFQDGIFTKRNVGNAIGAHSGTIVKWHPDPQFFNNSAIEVGRIKDLFKVLSCLCSGLTINLTHNNETETFYSNKGLNELVDDKVKDVELIDNRLNINFKDGKNKIDLVMTYTSNYSLNMISYVNIGETDSGPHISQIKTILTREFNKFFREKKWLKEKEDNLSGDDIQEGLVIAFNITAPNISYDAQTKSRIVKIDMSPFTTEITNQLQNWFHKNEKEIKVIADKALSARKAREAAKKARDAIRDGNGKKKKALKFASKLADCNCADRAQCEIYITEGDSATGGLKMGRNEAFQAVMPVRGKILNCQKASLEQIQKNAEIMTMIEAFGLTIDMKTMKVTYNKQDLRYGKIIIMSDADVDGSHIKNLFYTFIWNFCPQLLIDGYIYAGVPPLYKITEGNGKSYQYLKDDNALEEYKKNHSNQKYSVNRMKGLGEMSDDEVSETLMDPNKRIIKQITVNDEKKASKLFEQMMGDGVSFRKQFLKDYSEEAVYNVE